MSAPDAPLIGPPTPKTEPAPRTIPRRPDPVTMAGEPSGSFAEPDWQHWTQYHQPMYRVQIWRIKDGQQWEVTDEFGAHAVTDYVTSISIQHSIGSPAGQFSIGLLPIRLRAKGSNLTRTWGELLKPMDYIEITLARTRQFWDKPLPTIMERMKNHDPDAPYVVLRGFITNVRVVDTTDGQTGQPRRRVMVNGMNFGKLWLMFRMYLLQEQNEMYENKYGRLFSSAGTAGALTPSELLGIIYGAIFRPQLSSLAKHLPDVLKHKVYCDVPSDGRYRIVGASVSATQSLGPLDSLIRQYAVQPYTEFFTYDEPWPGGSPVTIWRWAPLLNRANRIPLRDHIPTLPTIRVLHADEITEHDIGNSDSDVLTYYHAGLAQQMGYMTNSQYPKLYAPGYLDYDKFLVYGFRPYEPQWAFYPMTPGNDPAVASTPELWDRQVQNLTSWLAAVFEHNIDNMEGQIACHGRPDIQIGDYLDVPESGYRFYVEGVSHNFVVGSGFTTSLSVTRGLPMRDLPTWVLPPGYEFDPSAGYGGNTTSPAGGVNSTTGQPYTAPPSTDNDPTHQPTPPAPGTAPKQSPTPAGGGTEGIR